MYEESVFCCLCFESLYELPYFLVVVVFSCSLVFFVEFVFFVVFWNSLV